MPKPEIHPDLREATVTCACGKEIHTRSVRGTFKIDICSSCHPFFTGEQRYVDAEGRIERFNRKYAK